jgi:hypothetical protein
MALQEIILRNVYIWSRNINWRQKLPCFFLLPSVVIVSITYFNVGLEDVHLIIFVIWITGNVNGCFITWLHLCKICDPLLSATHNVNIFVPSREGFLKTCQNICFPKLNLLKTVYCTVLEYFESQIKNQFCRKIKLILTVTIITTATRVAAVTRTLFTYSAKRCHVSKISCFYSDVRHCRSLCKYTECKNAQKRADGLNDMFCWTLN